MSGHLERCPWPGTDELMMHYHDTEWGVPVREDNRLFEHLTLDAFQAGLSWKTILHKREAFRRVLHEFDPARVAAFTPQELELALQDASIVRNRMKLVATVNNAQVFLRLQAQHGSFSSYLWRLVGGSPIQNVWTSVSQVPARTSLSDSISKELIQQGFKFVGSTIVYAVLQAAGLVNDHLVSCYRHAEVQRLSHPAA